jgi:N-acetylmuramoyl-L-alanine amidase
MKKLMKKITAMVTAGCMSMLWGCGTAEEEAVIIALDDVGEGTITKFDTYGTSFNVYGTLETDASVQDVSLVLKDLYSGEDSAVTELSYYQDGTTLTFSTVNALEGMYLETVAAGEYAVLVRLDTGETDDDGNAVYSYVTLSDSSGEDAIDYWTITDTDTGTNNEITISFETYDGIDYMALNCAEGEKPDSVADIVIDAGHGGLDSGTTSSDGEILEADVTLSYALALQEVLEEAGYTVAVTRDGTEDPNENTAYTMYDSGGRIDTMMSAHAKVSLSLHCNSSGGYYDSYNGVEIYVSSKSNGVLGTMLADAIVANVGMNYGEQAELKQVSDGVFVKTIDAEAIAEMAAEGINTSEITTDTDYYFMIRETGGIATGAYVDGSNPDYSANEWRDTNMGLETVLVEMGYMSNEHDLSILMNDEDTYVSTLADVLENYITQLKNVSD